MKKSADSGRFSLRIAPALHRDLKFVGEQLGLGLTDVVSMILEESVPSYLERAHAAKRRRAAARKGERHGGEKQAAGQAETPQAARPKRG